MQELKSKTKPLRIGTEESSIVVQTKVRRTNRNKLEGTFRINDLAGPEGFSLLSVQFEQISDYTDMLQELVKEIQEHVAFIETITALVELTPQPYTFPDDDLPF